jgi:hypothetical protein
MWLELRIELTLGLLPIKHLTNGNKRRQGNAVTNVRVFDIIDTFSPNRRHDC